MNGEHTEARGAATAVRRRAAAGAATIGLQGVAMQALSFAGSVVLARLLLPHNFGTVAFGLTLTTSLGLIASAGVAASLIRAEATPSRGDLEALLGFQLFVTGSFAGLTALGVVWFGEVGRVTALMVLALPFTSLRTPPAVLLERKLAYRPLVWAGAVEMLGYYAWTIGTVAAGLGVWGLASGSVVRSVVGSAAVISFAREGFTRPRFALSRIRQIRSVLGFGVRYQAAELATLVRDQGFNVGLVWIGGFTTLGYWTLAGRLLQIPLLFYSTLWRVSFPAMSRLIHTSANMRPIIERTVALAAVVSGAMLVPLAGSAPALIPALLGAKWSPAADILPGVCAGLAFAGPISVATAGYLWAVGDARAPLRAVMAQAVAWLGLGLGLFPFLGLWAIGIGGLCASVLDTLILVRATRKRVSCKLIRPVLAPYAAALLGGTAGWLVTLGGDSLLRALTAAGLAEGIFLLELLLVKRSLLLDTLRVGARALRGALSRDCETEAGSVLGP